MTTRTTTRTTEVPLMTNIVKIYKHVSQRTGTGGVIKILLGAGGWGGLLMTERTHTGQCRVGRFLKRGYALVS